MEAEWKNQSGFGKARCRLLSPPRHAARAVGVSGFHCSDLSFPRPFHRPARRSSVNQTRLPCLNTCFRAPLSVGDLSPSPPGLQPVRGSGPAPGLPRATSPGVCQPRSATPRVQKGLQPRSAQGWGRGEHECLCAAGESRCFEQQPLHAVVPPTSVLTPTAPMSPPRFLRELDTRPVLPSGAPPTPVSLRRSTASAQARFSNKAGSRTPGPLFHRAGCVTRRTGVVLSRAFIFNGAPEPRGVKSSHPQPPLPPDARLLNYNSSSARLLIKPN